MPDSVVRLVRAGLDVVVETGAGAHAYVSDADYVTAGATIATEDALAEADVVLHVSPLSAEQAGRLRRGAVTMGFLSPSANAEGIRALRDAGTSAFSVELLPRISRAQSMDALTSQALVSGYRAALVAADRLPKFLPLLMTAAGTVPPAQVLVLGAGVAGLQAIATARRLGAVVSATDVRPAAKEQVESLGAKFIAVEDEEFKQAETATGYAKPMSPEYQAKQAALVAEHIKKQDIVVTTALIPGRPAPKLVTAAMVASMRPGSILVDLAVERGGNVEGARLGEVAAVGEAKIIGYANVPGRIAASASALYARNLYAFTETLVDKATKTLKVDWNDELVKATNLTRDGAVVHPAFAPKGT